MWLNFKCAVLKHILLITFKNVYTAIGFWTYWFYVNIGSDSVWCREVPFPQPILAYVVLLRY